MAKISVNVGCLVDFQKRAVNMREKAAELLSAKQETNNLKNHVEDQCKKVTSKIQKSDEVLATLKVAIAKVTAKIGALNVELKSKQALLMTMPPVIMLPPMGAIPNPKYAALRGEIAALQAKIASLEAKKQACVAAQQDLEASKAELIGIKTELNNAIPVLESAGESFQTNRNKIYENSETAQSLLSRAIDAAKEYFGVRSPMTDVFSHKEHVVNTVNNFGARAFAVNGFVSTKRIGNYGEMRTSVEMYQHGFFELTKSPTSLDEKLAHGIDHVFFKDGTYYIGDSKSGHGAHLEPMTATGPQLSDTWIDARLDGAVGKDVADKIREQMIFEPDSIKRFVSCVNLGENTIYKSVDSNGSIILEGDDLNELFA